MPATMPITTSTTTTPSNALLPDQWRILHALVNCLIPPDEDLGGWDAGVQNYFVHQFAHDLRHAIHTYRLGLNTLDAESQASAGQPFALLDEATQVSLLQSLELGQTAVVWPVDPQSFLNMATNHAAEGFYGDPGGVAWRMVGYEVKG